MAVHSSPEQEAHGGRDHDHLAAGIIQYEDSTKMTGHGGHI